MWAVPTLVALLLLAAALVLLASAARVRARETLAARAGDDPHGAAVDELAGQHNLRQLRNPLIRYVCGLCWAAGIDITPRHASVTLAVAVAVVFVLTAMSPIAGLFASAVFVGLVFLVIQQRRRARRRKINAQLPHYLGYLMRALSAGNTLEEGIHSAAVESAEPVRGVFMSISRQVRLGASIEDTLADAARVHQLRALHILAMSARVNRRFGGSMRRVVQSLIATIGQQEAAARELKALTGETRFSAYVVAAIPLLISAFFYAQNPAYYIAMLDSQGGRVAIVVALLLQALGLLLIWRMMSRLQEPER